jgi:hypothetical protein
VRREGDLQNATAMATAGISAKKAQLYGSSGLGLAHSTMVCVSAGFLMKRA